MNSMWGKLNHQDQQWLTIQRMFLEILYINFYLYLSLEIWALFHAQASSLIYTCIILDSSVSRRNKGKDFLQ